MSSKESILAAIAKNKPDQLPLPEHPEYPVEGDLVEQYKNSIKSNGGQALEVKNVAEIQSYLNMHFHDSQMMLSLSSAVEGNFDIELAEDPHDLEHVELAILEGEWGVAENAAIWLPETRLKHRALPFIAQHLIVLLKKDRLLGNMHEVYQSINISDFGYGVFIAGPSKTADIEQSLVIGAHGPRSMTVFLMD
ncbi:L-lactate dehydrogenase complex protein LldG [Cyclobacterium lianum]|uniref:L-lactate dehydrogenase complex protein LldG n=1 Tax=Cyclobacterium lianum TaxID=388280 RepID=A0A1M7PQM3_9BACT|nr:LUD domain-containing protein [Cyclobacterium lianum]SHN19656.1 L-lactate dehydrogenase complex protein LldG [Cyclobacterium lianum]